jgi:hypothetical protein
LPARARPARKDVSTQPLQYRVTNGRPSPTTLQERGLYPTSYAGTTLRENLGVPAQYGIDPRIMKG